MTAATTRRLSVLGALSLLGCVSSLPSDDSEVTVETRALTTQTIAAKMSLPSGLSTAAFLVAQNKVQLSSGVVVNGAVWSAGAVVMQPDVKAQAVTCTGDVTLADRDTITTLTLGGRLVKGNRNVIGSTTRTTLSNVSSSTSVTFPTTNQSVTVCSGHSKPLSPGSYVTVNVSSGATLTLLAGDYYISKLVLESSSILKLSPAQGATRIFVASSMTFRGTLASGADASRLFVEYLGTTDVVLETPFWGTFVAPRASLSLGTANRKPHRGSFMAQTLTVQPYAKLEQVMFDPAGTTSSCAAKTWDTDGNPFTPCVAKTTCAPGSYISAEGDTITDRTCTGCASGQFSTTSNAPTCTVWTNCPAGTYVAHTPSATADRACVACPPGQTTNGDNQSQCLPVATECPAGTVQTGNTCTACVPGQYCAGGTSPQTTCAAGTWDHDAAPATVCVAKTTCLAGTFVASEGTTSSDRACTSCPTGTYGTTTNAATCTEWTTCFPGSFVSGPPSATADRGCSPCAEGQYSSGNNQASCLDQGVCAAGSTQTTPGTPTSPPECALCGPGNFCAGGTGPAIACQAGTWDHDGSAATPCVGKSACAPGNFVSSEGSTVSDRVCAACPNGQFSTTTNAESCAGWADCNAGSFVSNPPSALADRTCATCAAGSFSATPNAVTCTVFAECAPGTYVSAPGTTTVDAVCADCAAGSFSATSNTPACQTWTSCPPDTYVSNTPSATTDRVCTACPAGQTSEGGGATLCTTGIPIAVGASYACAVVGGGVKCWGDNYYGQLGDGTTTERHVPGPVSGLESGVTAMAAGYQHTCAVVNGGVTCWGDNSLGQLGNGSTTRSSLPVQVQGLESGATVIAAGAYHTCVAVNGSGLRCWGMGSSGQLGNGTSKSSSTVPVAVSGIGSAPTAVTAGWSHTCAVVSGGALCWGNNEDGALGDGTKTRRTVPVQVSGLTSGVTALAAGSNQTCALVGDGVRCWGYNLDGTLGDGTTVNRLTPVQVQTLESGVSTIAGTGSHMCVVLGSGPMMCWGQSGFGELGDGTVGSTSTHPTQVVGLTSGVSSIGAGYYDTCARVNGALQCWGQNLYGQIGDGTTTDRLVPTQVLFP